MIDLFKVDKRLQDLHPEMTSWRHELHAYPELAFEEKRTSAFVEQKLRSFGIEVHSGLAKTGIVGVLRAGDARMQSVGLRADMDALPLHEMNDIPYRSQVIGNMHACGHDGHMAMLLGAASYLSQTKRFEGTVYFIFQPAEENLGGARLMIDEGLFTSFPMSSVYALHNWPGIETGCFAIKAGPVMASMDTFEIRVSGRGTHAAMPHLGRDPIVAGSNLVMTLQTVASRIVSPTMPVVVSVTQIHAGDAWNIIPESLVLRGTVRTLDAGTQDQVQDSLQCIVDGIAASHDVTVHLDYTRGYPVTVNSSAEADFAAGVARMLVGDSNVYTDPAPSLGSEDFAFMLQERPGCYAWIGNGSNENGRVLHNPRYDFNDDILPIGASYFAALVEQSLPLRV